MWSEDNFQYAIENTEVILAPQTRIATFGQTSFRFYLISELMDQVNEVRVRDGRIHAERPQILTAKRRSVTSNNCASARRSLPSCATVFSFARRM
jgi:hypothetical protein